MKKKSDKENSQRRSQVLAAIGLLVVLVMVFSALAPSATDVRATATPTIRSLLNTRAPTATAVPTATSSAFAPALAPTATK